MSEQGIEWVHWYANKVKDAVVNKLMANAPDTGHFIESDARQRLDAIKTPDTPRDKNYRFYLSKFMLTHVVEKIGDHAFVIAVGMRIGKDGQQHHGFYIETGSSTAPAHPYLRPAVLQNPRDIIQLLLGD